MASTSRNATRALRTALRQLSQPRVQQRTFAVAANASRPSVQKLATSAFVQQTRGKKTVDFAGDKEVVYGELNGVCSTSWASILTCSQSATTGRVTRSWYALLPHQA